MDTRKENKIFDVRESRPEPGTSGVVVNDAGKLAVFAAIDAPAAVAAPRTRNMICPCGSGRKYKNCCLKRESRRVNTPPIGTGGAGKLPEDGKRWCDASEADQDTFLGQLSQYIERALPPGPSRHDRALYVFVMFDPDRPGQAVHVANCDVRQGVPEAFRQLATAFENGQPAPHPSPETVESMALNALATLAEAADAIFDLVALCESDGGCRVAASPTLDAFHDAKNYAHGVIAYAKNPKGSPVPEIPTVDDFEPSSDPQVAAAEENASAEFDLANIGFMPEGD